MKERHAALVGRRRKRDFDDNDGIGGFDPPGTGRHLIRCCPWPVRYALHARICSTWNSCRVLFVCCDSQRKHVRLQIHQCRSNHYYIIVAQNAGDVRADNRRSDAIPTIAARVKHQLKIENPYTVAFDIPFGCPGWLHGMILADYYIRSGDVKKVLVIGVETLSRISDPHDIDSMIYSDGAGATLVEATEKDAGILSHMTRSDTLKDAHLLDLGKSYNPNHGSDRLYLKMQGHEIYKYAVRTVPQVVKQSLDKAGFTLTDVKKVLIHQANEKMDNAILKRLFKLYNIEGIPKHIMPMTISWLGNSSVATLPTLLDLLQRGKLENHRLDSGDLTVFASVGAGMNINAMVYRVP